MRRGRGQRAGGVDFRVAGAGLALVLLGAALGVVGCGSGTDGYDATLRYPLRTDPLVLQTPPDVPPGPAPAGKSDEWVALLPDLRGEVADPRTLTDGQRAELTHALDGLFGTPAVPMVAIPDRPTDLAGLDLSPAHLAAGSRHYRRLCSQCHGLTGDGRGPTGAWVYPRPRDFRQGVFKVATGPGKPRAEALARVVRGGVPGSSMPLFDLIPDDEVRTLVAYTVHLSLRGEVEFLVTKALLDETGERDVADVSEESRTAAASVFDQWARAQAEPPPAPPPQSPPADASDTAYQESVRRGHGLFTAAGCASCHQDYGRAEGFRYDVWGGAVRVPDLTRGTFRWGKEPADLAARVRHGVPASGMPANPALTDGQVADLVAFVREVGYPQRLPADVRDQVYPPAVASNR